MDGQRMELLDSRRAWMLSPGSSRLMTGERHHDRFSTVEKNEKETKVQTQREESRSECLPRGGRSASRFQEPCFYSTV
jgi:hypothetical protein